MTDTYTDRMAKARATADKYFRDAVRTPEQLVARPPERRPVYEAPPLQSPSTPIPESANQHKDRERWSREKKAAFDAVAPHGVFIAAAQQALSVTVWGKDGAQKRFGHNRGMWLVKFGTTASWRDTITSLVNRIPFVEVKVDRRIWCGSAEAASTLALNISELVARKAEEEGYETNLLHGFQDVGPSLDWPILMQEIAALASRLKIACWTDSQLSARLDEGLRYADQLGVSPHDHLNMEKVMDQIMGDDAHRQNPHAFTKQRRG